ncbi:MAG: zinc-ribbon domain-containing protein, partial [Amaricoccus sp.]
MRLTCPNCGAEYEVPEGQIPAGGKHVQCTACHTRWFARAAQAALSEDQILARLETRGARPRPTLV